MCVKRETWVSDLVPPPVSGLPWRWLVVVGVVVVRNAVITQDSAAPHRALLYTHTRAHALSQTINKPTLYTFYHLHSLRRSIPGPAAAGWPRDFETNHLFIQTGGKFLRNLTSIYPTTTS